MTTSSSSSGYWNPAAAAGWSLLLTPVFGAWLHMRNWQTLGDTARARRSWHWVLGSAAFHVMLPLSGLFLPPSEAMDSLSWLAGLGLLLAWYYLDGKAQHALLLGRHGEAYPRRGWLLPLLVGGGVLTAWLGVLAGLTLLVYH